MNRHAASLGRLVAVSALAATGFAATVSGCDDSVLVQLLDPKAICASTSGCGAPCTDDFACAAGLYCSAQGECASDCSPEGMPCQSGLVCTNRGRCVKSATLNPDGGTGSTGGMVDLPPGGLDALRHAACVNWTTSPDPLPTSLMLVVDVSGSMDEEVERGDTKWEITRVALTEAISAISDAVSVGMLLYPNQDTPDNTEPQPVSTCVNVDALVPVAPLDNGESSQRDLLLERLWTGDPVNGGTPTHDAYAAGLDALRSSVASGDAHMLLITDGRPTYRLGCVGGDRSDSAIDEQPIIDAVADAQATGTLTFVIGSPGSERTDSGEDARPWLSRAAEAGGTAGANCSHDGPNYCHFDMVDESDFADALGEALDEISGAIVSCDYEIRTPPEGQTLDLGAVNVVWTLPDGDQKLFLRNDTRDCDDGWRFSDDNTRLVLCPTSCERVRSVAGELELFFGCTTEVVR